MHVLQHVYWCLRIMPAIIEIKSYTVVNGTSLFVSSFYPRNTLVAKDSLVSATVHQYLQMYQKGLTDNTTFRHETTFTPMHTVL